MTRRAFIVLGALVVIGLIVWLVWPPIDRELMKIPMTDGITALRTGDFPGMAACFTPKATVGDATYQIPVDTVLKTLKPLWRDDPNLGALRFAGYENIRRSGHTATADFQVIYELNNDDLPYRNVPIRQNGEVTLRKTGWFTWKIERIRFTELNLKSLLESDGAAPLLEGTKSW